MSGSRCDCELVVLCMQMKNGEALFNIAIYLSLDC
jgi:hypothetical protein